MFTVSAMTDATVVGRRVAADPWHLVGCRGVVVVLVGYLVGCRGF
uniref:Uncharacterized protein n=1 Tax=Arundo donax TaxID=35708 RepID=A0A0A9AFC7_ARUDO